MLYGTRILERRWKMSFCICTECSELMVKDHIPAKGWRFNGTCFQHDCEALKSKLNKMGMSLNNDYQYASKDVTDYEMLIITKQLQTKLEELRFIPVSEGLPKKGKRIEVVCHKENYPRILIGTRPNVHSSKYFEDGYGCIINLEDITHWRYIILPKGGE